MKLQPKKIVVLAIGASLLLASCGQRGPLYHPEKPAAIPKPQEQADQKTKTAQ
ncbi:MAG: lipoprotein [Limnobacter sp.]|nr:lipoprotein [Limnobacter sp.]